MWKLSVINWRKVLPAGDCIYQDCGSSKHLTPDYLIPQCTD
ncbi:hypothetical protein [Nostoc punctiforme]|nr:hypothetical protein [Nostoc punctiforme]